ncbi:MAG: citrate lyase holo-[acyl-carrier protein] synthase [Thermovirgaceae bacterium]|nr:citrate lyase holo-[acyl-carrier protein] synthase [Synergistales bacterium]HRS48626.1 citrate lyase holo-[acyl-carrier protein] synthase [Thermovirgaceae bacterium]
MGKTAMTELERLLAGREERASLQAHVLRGSEVIVQVSLNIPGLPKRMAGDREVVSLVMGSMRREMQPLGGGPVLLFSLDNGAGYACILGANGVDPVAVKRLAMAVEDLPWGSVIDVDVLTRTGALHRAGLTGGERKCFLCGRPAKDCARSQRHEYPQLREACRRMLAAALEELRKKGGLSTLLTPLILLYPVQFP